MPYTVTLPRPPRAARMLRNQALTTVATGIGGAVVNVVALRTLDVSRPLQILFVACGGAALFGALSAVRRVRRYHHQHLTDTAAYVARVTGTEV